MPTTPTSFPAAYLELAATRHEKLGRLAATSLCHPFFPTATDLCRRRKCRRDGVCSGAMRPATHLVERSQRLKQHGVSSILGTELPACLADADDKLFAAYEASQKTFDDDPPQGPVLSWPTFVMLFKCQQRATRYARRAASDTDTLTVSPVSQP